MTRLFWSLVLIAAIGFLTGCSGKPTQPVGTGTGTGLGVAPKPPSLPPRPGTR